MRVPVRALFGIVGSTRSLAHGEERAPAPPRLTRRQVLRGGVAAGIQLALPGALRAAAPPSAPAAARQGTAYIERYEVARAKIFGEPMYMAALRVNGVHVVPTRSLGIFSIDLVTRTVTPVVRTDALTVGMTQLSPDGRLLAYGTNKSLLHIRDLETGKEVVHQDPRHAVRAFLWAGSSERLIAMVSDPSYKLQFDRPDVAQFSLDSSGDPHTLVRTDLVAASGLTRIPRYAPGGDHVVFERLVKEGAREFSRIVLVRAETPLRLPRVADLKSGTFLDAQWSPKGDRLLLLGPAGKESARELFVTSASEFAPQKLQTKPYHWYGRPYGTFSWSPQGDRVAYQARPSNEGRQPPQPEAFVHDLVTDQSKQYTQGTETVTAWPEDHILRNLQWTADGQRLLFSQSTVPLRMATYRQERQLHTWQVDLNSGKLELLTEGFADIVVGCTK